MAILVYEFRATYTFMERIANLLMRYLSWEVVCLAYSLAYGPTIRFVGMAEKYA